MRKNKMTVDAAGESWMGLKYMKFDGTILDFSHKVEISNYGSVKWAEGHTPHGSAPNKYAPAVTVKEDHNGRKYLPYLSIRIDKTTIPLHRAVLSTFNPLPNPVAGLDTNHINGDVSNNHISNLEWKDASSNRREGRLKDAGSNPVQ